MSSERYIGKWDQITEHGLAQSISSYKVSSNMVRAEDDRNIEKVFGDKVAHFMINGKQITKEETDANTKLVGNYKDDDSIEWHLYNKYGPLKRRWRRVYVATWRRPGCFYECFS